MCKLIVSSRLEAEIVKELKSVSQTIALDTGNRVSEESKRDIQLYFETKFRDMNAGDTWPGPGPLVKLTEYAAGLFIWARMVIGFICERDGNPFERLKEVLINMAKVSDDDLLGRLYGQILFKICSRLRLPIERDSMSLALASLSFVDRPLRRDELSELLVHNDGTTSEFSIGTAFNSLKPSLRIMKFRTRVTKAFQISSWTKLESKLP